MISDVSYDWCLGKPCGYVLKKENTVFWRTNAKGKQISKSFALSHYNGSEEDAIAAALEYGKKWSDEHGYTRNQVRRLPDGIFWKDNPNNFPVTQNTLEVKIDDDLTMLVDLDDLNIVQEYAISKTKSNSNNSHHYAILSFKGTREEKQNGKRMLQRFHNFLTGFELVDHLNRNPMDNRRCNLRDVTYKENNNNRTCTASGMRLAPEGIPKTPGVRFVLDRPGGAWQARIKQDGKERTVSFGVKRYGNEEACRMATDARKQFNDTFHCKNSIAKD